MILEMFSLYDTKALCFSQPFYSANQSSAVRTVMDTLAGGDSLLSRHPDDYILFHVARFDDSNGAVEPLSKFENMGPLSGLMPKPKAPPMLRQVEG